MTDILKDPIDLEHELAPVHKQVISDPVELSKTVNRIITLFPRLDIKRYHYTGTMLYDPNSLDFGFRTPCNRAVKTYMADLADGQLMVRSESSVREIPAKQNIFGKLKQINVHNGGLELAESGNEGDERNFVCFFELDPKVSAQTGLYFCAVSLYDVDCFLRDEYDPWGATPQMRFPHQ